LPEDSYPEIALSWDNSVRAGMRAP